VERRKPSAERIRHAALAAAVASVTEFDLLAFMMKHPDAVLTYVKLLRTIWGPEYGGELKYLRIYVRMLRKKIEKDPARPEGILTEPRVGYRFPYGQNIHAARP
jgi:DNA-binding response OmpR family regulator